MTVASTTVEERIAALEARIEGLAARLAQFETAAGHGPVPVAAAATTEPPGAVTAAALAEAPPAAPLTRAPAPSKAQGDLVARAGFSALLPRVSAVSFLLVVALLLRTLTDSGVFSARTGAVVGMCYAALLVAAGWFAYGRRSVLAPVFAVCGAGLLCSIVVETHSHFRSLPTVPAHLLLAGMAAVMAALGERQRRALPGVVGVLGAAVAGVLLLVPEPSFPAAASLLLVVTALGAVTSRRVKGDWLAWVLFVESALLLQVWAVRARVAVQKPLPGANPAGAEWLFPLLALYAALWYAHAVHGMLRPPRGKLQLFALVLPSAGGVAAFGAALQLAAATGASRPLGLAGLLGAAFLVATAAWAGLRRGGGAAALNSLAVAAVFLTAFSFTALTGSFLGALPLLSVSALALAALSARWESGGTRLVSYLLQIFVAIALAATLLGSPSASDSPAAAAFASAVLFGSCLLHYRWCRGHRPPEGSVVFAFLGSGDRCAAALLTAALSGAFFLLRTGLLVTLGAGAGESRNAFLGAQSLLINGAAILLLAIAAARRNAELRNVALLVTLVGAAKVFLYDLIVTQGVPRVLSVFSFGLLAAVASLVVGRWQRGAPQ